MRAVCALFAGVVLVGVGTAFARADSRSEVLTLVFMRGETVMLIDSNGARQRRAPFAGYPTYSRDGRRVVFVVRRNSGSLLFVANANGSSARMLVRAGCFGNADLSPDATTVVYAEDCEVDFMSIWAVDRDGRHRRQLAGRWNLEPHWAPDGRTILFTSNRRTRHPGWRLFLMNGDGGASTRLRALGTHFAHAGRISTSAGALTGAGSSS